MFLKNKKLAWEILVFLVVAGVALFAFLNLRRTIKKIDSFEACAEAGNFVIQSYPRQCKTPDGRVFVEKTDKQKSEETKTYTDVDKLIEVQKGEKFQIALGSNPTTGYQWRLESYTNLYSFIDKKFTSESDLMGAGGVETFRFSALNSGETEIVFTYHRPWEEKEIEEKVFKIKIF